jgi:2'-5' RNA ligase
VRLFLAVDPDPEARNLLTQQLATVRRRLAEWDACVRWTAPDAIHLTVRFLGEIPDVRLTGLTDALGSELSLAPFDVQVQAAGTFGKRREVRTIWLSIGDGRDGLIAVHAELTRRLRAAGWPDEDRPFSPHLTIGRVRDRHVRRTVGLADAVAAVPVRSIGWQVDRVVLYSSDLSGPKPAYEGQHQIALSGPGRHTG